MKKLTVTVIAFLLTLFAATGHTQNAGTFSTLQTTSTSATSVKVGCVVGSSTCTGGIKAGPIDVASVTSGGFIEIANNVPVSTANRLYNNAGTLTWNGSVLAVGGAVSGTTGTIAKFTAPNALGDSIMTEALTTVTVAGTLAATTLSGSCASCTAVPAAQLTGTITSATQDLITRLGTITSGVWSGTIIGLSKGGTGVDLSGTGGTSQFLRQNTVGGTVTVVRPSSSDLSDSANVPLLNAATNTFTGKLVFGTTQTFSWNAKIVANVYQAASDGFVVVWEDSTGGGGGYTTVLSDAANPPTTVRGQVTYLNDYRTLTVPIRKGDYYKVVDTPSGGTASYTVYWVPLGTAG